MKHPQTKIEVLTRDMENNLAMVYKLQKRVEELEAERDEARRLATLLSDSFRITYDCDCEQCSILRTIQGWDKE